jgi:tetratricopeptide (TPR) repeat protein
MDKLTHISLILVFAFLSACADSADNGESNLMPDAAAIAENNHAVGLMGQFRYKEAHALFTALVKKYPDWLDGQVNLAIATLNRQQEDDEAVALGIVDRVLKSDPDNMRAHYVAGLLRLYLSSPNEALTHFRKVVNQDPNDAYAAYYLAQCLSQLSNHEESLKWYERAIEKDSYLRSAYYGTFQALQRLKRTDKARELVKLYQKLANNPRSKLAEFKYTRMGSKAEAIAFDLPGKQSVDKPVGPVFLDKQLVSISSDEKLPWRKQANKRPMGIAVVDLESDGRPDLFIANALFEGKSKNLVLINQGEGFVASPDHLLAKVPDVNAAVWGDYDNDGLVDVYLCRHGPNQLWRQVTRGHWQNVTESTKTAGGELDTIDASFFDADHDGDLDLFAVNANGHNELFNNNLDGTFRPLAVKQNIAGSGKGSRMVIPVDIDHDRDVDIIVINEDTPHEVYLNDRLWSYRKAEGYEEFANSPALAALVADSNADGVSEIYTLHPDGRLLRWQVEVGDKLVSDVITEFEHVKNAGWAQLAIMDVDGDGSFDVTVTTSAGWSVHALRDNTILYQVRLSDNESLKASMPFIMDAKSGPSMLGLDQNGLSAWKPGPGRHAFMTLDMSGKEDKAESMRSNASGIGAYISVRVDSRWTMLDTLRNHSGPGQSLQPLAIGLGGATAADFVAIDWSDGVFQSELNVQAGVAHKITETQRQLSSCPVMFVWNGEEYVFVSDLLGVGGIGYAIGPGEYAEPRPWENYLLPDGLLQPKQGRYIIKIGEPMEENAYLDAARLAVYDVPEGWSMVMDERMGILGPEPTGKPRFYRNELLPEKVTNDRNADITDIIRKNDHKAAPVGELDYRFIGRLKDEHILTLKFNESLDARQGDPMLVIDGWVEYPYSQTMFAAWQAKATFDAPTLEAKDENGNWQLVMGQFGYPAGMPRRMSVPLDNLPKGTRELRLRTNMQIYWDRIAVAYAETPPRLEKQVLPIEKASLSKSGFAKRTSHEQFRPFYDYNQRSPFWDTRYMEGFYTRRGPVEELVMQQDDAVAIIGPGEEVHLEFKEAVKQPEGWQRYFVLESNGWAKDMDLFTRDGETVGPMPSTGKPVALRDQLHTKYNTEYRAGY